MAVRRLANPVTLCDDREVYYATASGQIRMATNNPEARVPATTIRESASTGHGWLRQCQVHRERTMLSVLIDHGGGRVQVQGTDISAETGGPPVLPARRGRVAALALFPARVSMIMSWVVSVACVLTAWLRLPGVGVSVRMAVCWSGRLSEGLAGQYLLMPAANGDRFGGVCGIAWTGGLCGC